MRDQKYDKAKSIIDNYAAGHAVTAFVTGHLGGQFGADRIPLTILTTKMICDLCTLYGVNDGLARRIHIGATLARLTATGTALAHTVLNWIPVVGPGANSLTTMVLTKSAGKKCVRDLQRGRMTTAEQVKDGLIQGIRALILSEFGVDALDEAMDVVEKETAAKLSDMDVFGDAVSAPDLVKGIPADSQYAGEQIFESMIKQFGNGILNGDSFSVSELWQYVLENISKGMAENAELMERLNLAKISIHEDWAKILPKEFSDSIQSSINRCLDACDEASRKRALAVLFQDISNVLQSSEEIASFLEENDSEIAAKESSWSAEERYARWVESVYRKYMPSGFSPANLAQLCEQCGKAFDEISKRNLSHGYWKGESGFDHDAVWYMTEWIQKEFADSSIVKNRSTRELSTCISDSIMEWVRKSKEEK